MLLVSNKPRLLSGKHVYLKMFQCIAQYTVLVYRQAEKSQIILTDDGHHGCLGDLSTGVADLDPVLAHVLGVWLHHQ